jgi:hypothetical protein
MSNGRCPNHGGKSLSGPAHPNYKHGRYSKLNMLFERLDRDRRRSERKSKRALAALLREKAMLELAKGRPLTLKEAMKLAKDSRPK